MKRLCFVLLFAITSSSFATTFVVPNDAELVGKAGAIVIGTVQTSLPRRNSSGIETTYSLSVERVLKGNVSPAKSLWVTSPGGAVGDSIELVSGAAHFTAGDHVLLFLTEERGEWQVTDWAVGKFRFARSAEGINVLVRDEGAIVGWDRANRPYVEQRRIAATFIHFIEETVAGKKGTADYFAGDGVVSAAAPITPLSAYPSYTYAFSINGTNAVRWSSMSSGVTLFKNASQNAVGLGDGGVSAIGSAVASWNNDSGSQINLSYGGTTSATKSIDSINSIIFNDPGNWITGSWTGAGVIATTFTYVNGTYHTFDGSTWASIYDADIVFQDGFPGTDTNFNTALLHEIGHVNGFRHSNEHWSDKSTCNSSVEECTSAAVMNAYIVPSYGFTLQSWDRNAAAALYPATSSCTDPWEPNDSSLQAYGPIVTGSYSGKICSPTDVDWFSADFVAGTTVTLTLSVPASNDYDLELYGPDANFKVGSYNGTGQSESIVYTVPTSGRYAFRVYGFPIGNGSYNTTTWYVLGYSSTAQPQPLAVSRNGTGSGSVTSSPAGINCGATCSASFAYNTAVTLSASADSGSTFTGWSGEGCSGTGTCQVTMSQSRSVTATFNAQACSYSISPQTASGDGSGGTGSVSVTGTPTGCSGSWSAAGQSFVSLTGISSGSGGGSWSVPYSFPQNPSTSSSRQGSIVFSGSFPSGGTFTLTQAAAPLTGCTYSLSQPSANVSGASGTGSVTVTGGPNPCNGSWSASSGAIWLNLTGTTGASGAGSWPVSYSYSTNPSTTTPRSGSINFTGSLTTGFTVNQDASPTGNLPNMAPYQAPNWSAPIVASTTPGSQTDTPLFTTADNIYVQWAIINNGSALAANTVYSDLYLDGTLVGSYPASGGFAPGASFSDFAALGNLSAGMHTIALITDSTNAIAESDESDNRYTKSIRVGTAPVTCALGDFNGDHKADILWRIDGTGSDAMWLMNGATKSLGQYIETSPSRWIVAGIGDFDGDTHADILWRDPVTGENAIWLMNGTTKTLGAYIESAGPEWVVAGIGDFNGDHKADILWRNLATGADAMWLMNGTTKSLGTYIESAAPNWSVAGIGDFNNDGMADILWRDDVTGADAIWLMSGTTKSVGAVIESAPQRWRVVGVGDFNLDGRADILWRDFVTGENAIWLMNGTTKSVGALIESAPPQWRAVGVGDLDGDGRADILWRDTSGNDAVWLMNGTTKSVGAYAESASMPWRVVP